MTKEKLEEVRRDRLALLRCLRDNCQTELRSCAPSAENVRLNNLMWEIEHQMECIGGWK